MSGLFNMVMSMSLIASVVIMIVMIFRVLLKNKMTKTFSYVLWGIVLIKLIVPVSFESSFSVFNIIPIPESIEWNKSSDIGREKYF